mmetsp:Transcript_2085/g.4672  ORF Transcript_2085/g.4672 Transcript_2085/m.4672 type:complete len:246 (-) Transcript_2085:691-1428(-)
MHKLDVHVGTVGVGGRIGAAPAQQRLAACETVLGDNHVLRIAVRLEPATIAVLVGVEDDAALERTQRDARAAVERCRKRPINRHVRRVAHCHDASVLPGACPLQHRDRAAERGVVSGAIAEPGEGERRSESVDGEHGPHVVALDRVERHDLTVTRPHVLEGVVRRVHMLCVPVAVVVHIVTPRDHRAARTDGILLKDDLLDVVEPVRCVCVPQLVAGDSAVHGRLLAARIAPRVDDNERAKQIVV